MASSGIRLGAFDTIRWKDITPICNESKKEIITAKLVVYSGENEQYFTFVTPEVYSSLKNWIDYRISHGGNITGDSWLMRDLWQTTEMKYGANFGVVTYPKQLKSLGIKSLLERALRAQGLVKPLDKEKNENWKYVPMEVDTDEPHDCPDREDIEDKDGNSYLTSHPSGDSNSISSNYNSSSSSYYDQKEVLCKYCNKRIK
ncbi:MAG TPA: hypothetical protein VJU13_03690 [Candidatus Nitrosocosmicus sp.]|nr:hypothetical protein [Candidatus Nitrosocosmicus sp.]